ncbi:MAG: S1/P1 nuclease [Candidatus Sumerlaeaceae bacterium]|nr:S1/P1 nuclease [Candidatus Sumerlaeaceae bacterium]
MILALLSPKSHCLAYGVEGHKIVALVAENHLTSATRAKVGEILNGSTMADVSSWADSYRQTHRETAGWHYIDIEISDHKILAGSKTHGTVVDAISSQSKILAEESSTSESRRMALKFIIHFLGDVSQPLHCADNYDSGGNKVKVDFLGRNGSLHQVWDTMLLQKMMAEDQASSATGDLRKLANAVDAEFLPNLASIQEGSVNDWAEQSYKVAAFNAYSYLKNDTLSSLTVTLDQKYYNDNKPVLRRMLASGGYRLALVLNQILDPSPVAQTMVAKRD